MLQVLVYDALLRHSCAEDLRLKSCLYRTTKVNEKEICPITRINRTYLWGSPRGEIDYYSRYFPKTLVKPRPAAIYLRLRLREGLQPATDTICCCCVTPALRGQPMDFEPNAAWQISRLIQISRQRVQLAMAHSTPLTSRPRAIVITNPRVHRDDTSECGAVEAWSRRNVKLSYASICLRLGQSITKRLMLEISR